MPLFRDYSSAVVSTTVVLGAAAIAAYVYGRYMSGKRVPVKAKEAPLSERIISILTFIQQAQVDEEGKASVNKILFTYFTRWFNPIIPQAPANLNGQNAGAIAATLLEGLDVKTDEQRKYMFFNDLSLPPSLTEEVMASVGASPVRSAFAVSEVYFSLCQNRSSVAREGTAPAEEVCEVLLKELWDITFSTLSVPTSQLTYSRQGEGWSELGFQGLDPLTDLRGGGLMSLEDYVAFSKNNTDLHVEIVRFNREQHSTNGTSWFLEACVSIQLTVQLSTSAFDVANPASSPGAGATGGKLLKRVTPVKPATSPLRFTPPIVSYLYSGPAGEVRKRLQHLHGLYFKAFFTLWRREMPFVMEYQSFMDKTFYPESPMLVEGWLPK